MDTQGIRLTRTEAAGSVRLLLLGNVDDVDLEVVELQEEQISNAHRQYHKVESTYAHRFEQVLGVGVDVQLARFGLGDVQSGDLRDILVLALTLLFLQLEGDTADRATLDSLHEVGGVTSDLNRQAVSTRRL